MAESPFATRIATRQDELLASAQFRQDVRQKAEAGDRALARDSWSKASHAISDRYYNNRKREDGSTVPGTAQKRALIIGKNYRQALQNARQTKGGMTQGAGEMAKKAASAAISTGTSELLQQAWLNLIDSYGLTLLWINVHVFCRFTIGEEYFCKLGREWLPRGEKGLGGAMQTEGKAAGGGMTKSILGMPLGGLGILEALALGILNALVAVIILIALAPFIIVAWVVSNPTDALLSNFSAFVEFIKLGFNL